MTLKNLFSGEKGKKILIFGAAAVMLLLLLSSVTGGDKKTASRESTVAVEDAAKLEQSLEQRLKELLEKIDGAGSVSVMVTLDRTSQALYEKDEKSDIRSTDGSENTSRETEVVLVGSSKEPLLAGTVQPKVRGAAVVCSGASDPVIKEKVTYAVARALNIGLSRVYVTD